MTRRRIALAVIFLVSGVLVSRSRFLDPTPRAVVEGTLPEETCDACTAEPTMGGVAEAPKALPPTDIRHQRQDVRWEASMPESAFSEFREWTRVFATARSDAERDTLRREGLVLAEARRRDLSDLIEKNPKRALELAVPLALRRTLPPDITALLEELVSGRGDLLVVATIALPGRERWVPPMQRFVQMTDGREFAAYTYGRRDSAPSRNSIGVHGIALDGKMALGDLPGRIMEPAEVAEVKARQSGATVCPTSGLPSDANGDEVVVDWDGSLHSFYCAPKHAEIELCAAADREDAYPLPIAASNGGPAGVEGEPPIAYSGYTEGTKKMLIIRVDFPDKTGQVVSDATLTTLINNMASHWNAMAFDKMTWSAVGSGSAFTPTLRLPKNHAEYTGFSTMLNAARAAAEDAGYDYRNYNFEVVVTGDKPDVGFGGVAYVGGRGAWLANGQWNLGVCSHEVGHNFGLNHAGFWDTTDGSPIGVGDAVEYGNPYDQMGGASSSTNAHFGARQKNHLDWIPDADVKKIGANGSTTTRLYACDKKAATGTRAIAIDRSGTTNDYWLEVRQTYAASNKWIRDGIILNWGPYSISNAKPLLLDTSATTSTKDDAALLIGSTFSDTEKGVYITPVGKGTESGISYVDVTVNRGTYTGNRKPTVAVGAGNLNPAVNASVAYTATASDPDGDTIGYYWEWGDGSFTANNGATASHAYATSGTKTVRCIVTDMKGQTATGQLLVQVGTSTTFFAQGLVRKSTNEPLAGVTVRADATHSDTTDSEGYFAITGLSAGSYTVSATKTGLTLQPSGFANPVSVGPSRQNVNFVAPPGLPNFGPMKPGLVDSGSNSGDVFLALSDPDTLVTDLTLSGSSSNTALVPNASITFATIGSLRTVKVAAPANVSGQINVTLTATDPLGGSASYVWPVTINGRPTLTTSARSTVESTPLDIDLRTFASDDFTALDDLRFEISQVINGAVSLLPDGHTARFTPPALFNGTAQFLLTARDRSLSSRTLFLWDFEPPDTTDDGKISDLSNFNRIASFETAGSGGEFTYSPDVPPALAPQSRQSMSMIESEAGAVRVRKTLSTSDLNYNDADWSFCAWVKRNGTATDDFVLHLGEGNGFASKEELGLYFPSNGHTLVVRKNNVSGQQALLTAANVPSGVWHHVCLTYDRTASNSGTLALYVDGFLQETVAGIAMGLAQTFSMYLGGTADNTANLDRWFDGQFDDVMLADAVLSRREIYDLATKGAQFQLGLNATTTVTVNVTGTNQAPSILPLPDIGLATGTPSSPIKVTVSDPESEARTLTLTASSSNPSLLPQSGIAVGAAPPAWSSSDLGTVGATGSMTENRGTFVLRGAGSGIGGTSDNFRSTRQDVSGDVDLSARIVSLDYTHQEAKAGVMLRDNSNADAPYAFACVTAGQGVSFEFRSATGAAAVIQTNVNGVAAPCWLRMVRVGNTYAASYAPDTGEIGTPPAWQPLGSPQAITFPTATYRAGLAVTSRVNATLATAVIDNLGGTIPTGGNRILTLSPAPGQTGIATVTLTASDGSLTNTTAFNAVIGINTPPTVSPVDDLRSIDGQALNPFVITLGDLHTPVGSLVVGATSSNPWLLPNGRIMITGTGATRTVSLRPVPGGTGTTTIDISVSDGQTTTVRRFVVTIDPGDPALFVPAGANWRYLDTGASPAGWQTPGFNDGSWPFGPSQLGFGDGDEETLLVANGARTTNYFRRSFEVTNRFDYEQLRLLLQRDDGAVVYLNGIEIARSNMPAGPITSATFAASTVSGSAEQTFFPIVVNRPPLLTGTNVLAVEVHQVNLTSSDLSFNLELRGGNPEPLVPVAAGSVWRFLDDGTEAPAAWKDLSYVVPATWKSGAAQLGYGDGDEITVVEGGPASARYTTTFFRQTFTVDDPAAISQAFVRFLRDDGIVAYLNGVEILRDNLPEGTLTSATRALIAIGNADESLWHRVPVDPAAFQTGPNVLAVQIHQASATSSDLSFDLETLLYTREALPSLSAALSVGSTIDLKWPKWAAGWQLQESPDMKTWNNVPSTPIVSNSGTELSVPNQPLARYFRLVAP